MRVSLVLATITPAGTVLAWPLPAAHRLRRMVGDRASVGGRHRVLVAVLLLALVAELTRAPVLAAAVFVAGLGLGRVLTRRARRRRRTARQDAAAEIVFALAAELRAGRTPAQALDSAAAAADVLRDELQDAARAVRAGAPAADRLRAVAGLPGCAALGGVAAAWLVTEQAGGAVADVLERVGRSLDEDAADRRAFEAAMAGPRATMALLAGLPLLGVAMAQSAGAQPVRLLLHRPIGWALLAAAAALEGVGLVWSRRIARGARPR